MTEPLEVDPSRMSRTMTLGEHLWAFLKETVVVVVGAVVVASLIRALVGQMFLIPSASMENTLMVHDRVVVEKLTSIRRGQVVVFADPGGWLTGATTQERGRVGRALEFVGVLPDTSTEHLVKRVIGLPGDHVVCCDPRGRITVNDRPLDEGSYLNPAAGRQRPAASDIRFDVVVPRQRIFVLGDNRTDSRDSRCHLDDVTPGQVTGDNAFVAEDLVVGRAVAVIWPLSDLTRLPIPATFGSVTAAAVPAPDRPAITTGPGARC